MPINAGAEYFIAQRKFLEARTADEKIAALQEMIKLAPKHKGSENLLADLRKKLARLRKEKQKTRKSKKKAFSVPKEGSAQVSIVGLAGVGKSELLKNLTGVGGPGDHPYSTKTPAVGMMYYEDVPIQLVEIPSTFDPQYVAVAHNSDVVLCVIDLSEPDRAKEMEDFVRNQHFRKVLWCGNKLDLVRSNSYALFRGYPLSHASELLRVSAATGENIAALKRALWSLLNLIRVYTKTPGRSAETNPLTLPAGSTVRDVALDVHKSMVKSFRFARIWGSAPFPGAQVGLNYNLKDGDVVEIHTV